MHGPEEAVFVCAFTCVFVCGQPRGASGQRVTENIYLCPDDMYRWSFEYDMLKNPVILITIYKAMGLSCVIVFALITIVNLIQGNGFSLPAWDDCKYGVMCLVILLGPVLILAYLIVARSYGWRYMVLFEMNEKGILHRQMKSQFKKAQALGWVSAMAGMMTGSMSAAGAGLLAASRASMYSEFGKVKAVIVKRGFSTIKVNGRFMHNQVYAGPGDFDFVLDYINRHTPQAKHR